MFDRRFLKQEIALTGALEAGGRVRQEIQDSKKILDHLEHSIEQSMRISNIPDAGGRVRQEIRDAIARISWGDAGEC